MNAELNTPRSHDSAIRAAVTEAAQAWTCAPGMPEADLEREMLRALSRHYRDVDAPQSSEIRVPGWDPCPCGIDLLVRRPNREPWIPIELRSRPPTRIFGTLSSSHPCRRSKASSAPISSAAHVDRPGREIETASNASRPSTLERQRWTRSQLLDRNQAGLETASARWNCTPNQDRCRDHRDPGLRRRVTLVRDHEILLSGLLRATTSSRLSMTGQPAPIPPSEAVDDHGEAQPRVLPRSSMLFTVSFRYLGSECKNATARDTTRYWSPSPATQNRDGSRPASPARSRSGVNGR